MMSPMSPFWSRSNLQLRLQQASTWEVVRSELSFLENKVFQAFLVKR